MLSRLFAWIKGFLRAALATPAHKAAAVVGLLVGGLLGLPVQDMAFTYMWKDDRFCNDCHVHDYANEAYERSVHFGVTTCHDCHMVPIRHYPRNLVVTVFTPPQGPEDIPRPEVDSVICAACHSREMADVELTGPMPDEWRPRIAKIDDFPLHQLHLRSKSRKPGGPEEEIHEGHGGHHERASWDAGIIGCRDCHGSENNRAHAFEATRANCVECHDTESFTGTEHGDPHGVSQLECLGCHLRGFTTPDGDAAAEATGSAPLD